LRWLAQRFWNAMLALFNGIMGVFFQSDVLHNRATRVDDMTMQIASCEEVIGLALCSGFV